MNFRARSFDFQNGVTPNGSFNVCHRGTGCLPCRRVNCAANDRSFRRRDVEISTPRFPSPKRSKQTRPNFTTLSCVVLGDKIKKEKTPRIPLQGNCISPSIRSPFFFFIFIIVERASAIIQAALSTRLGAPPTIPKEEEKSLERDNFFR